MTEPTADLRLQWEREARSKANSLYDEIMEGLKHKACVTGYLAARLVAYQEYQKLLEEKDREIARLKQSVQQWKELEKDARTPGMWDMGLTPTENE